jgi:hypothetical protein
MHAGSSDPDPEVLFRIRSGKIECGKPDAEQDSAPGLEKF